MSHAHILIIGKRPLPIGGVTVHVERLLEWLDDLKIQYSFYDLKRFNIIFFCKSILLTKYAHLHSSSPYLRIVFCILCKLLGTVSIVTYHGNIGRYNNFKNFIDILSVKMAKYPIVLNINSYNQVRRYNHNLLLQSAYINPIKQKENTLSISVIQKIQYLKNRYKIVACTNAYNLSYDNNGNEIYGISYLINYFNCNNQFALIISDPSGNNRKIHGTEFENILFIDTPHSFMDVLKLADCFIRYTSTDGDSLSIHEAQSLGVPVIATDVVSRPEDVLLVKLNSPEDLTEIMSKINTLKNQNNKVEISKLIPDVIKFYTQLLRI